MEDEHILDENVRNAECTEGETERFAVKGNGTANHLRDRLVLVVFADNLVLNRLRLSVDTLPPTSVLLSTSDDATSRDCYALDLGV